MGTHIIGCAGLRPAAVIMPINTLIRSRIVEANNTTVTLLHTDNKKIQECYNICKKWLKKNFGSLQINNYTFDQNENFYSILLQDNEAIYFNVNGGMNWEVALLSLFLPDHTRCMYSDSNNLYTWNISEDIKTATPHKLQNIGLDSYNALSPLVSINEHNSLSKTLSNNVRGVLERIGINLAYSIEHKGIEKQILELINKRLVWAREKNGSLYLLFDLQNTDDVDNRKLTDCFRIITAALDPINFNITILTDKKHVRKRAQIEGVNSISINQYGQWEKKVEKWVKNDLKIKPKMVMPNELLNTAHYNLTNRNEGTTKIKAALLVCLGDNIETTIKAIHYHPAERIYLFFDNTSERIKFFAQSIKRTLNSKEIILIATDHKGSDIFSNIERLACGLSDIQVNITPGVKSESVVMARAAKKIGRKEQVFSIFRTEEETNGEKVSSILNPKISFSVCSPKINDLISCHMAPLKAKADPLESIFWSKILKNIANGKITPSGHILNLMITDESKKAVIVKERRNGSRTVLFKINNKRYNINNKFFDKKKGGIWWEAVVCKAIRDNLTEDVFWEVTWDWVPSSSITDVFFTELDVVFSWNGQIGAISCKTGKEGVQDETRYLIKSEAYKRFGRFTLAMVAVPYDKGLTGKIENGVLYLTPSVLNNSKCLIECISRLKSSLQTSARGKSSGVL